MTHAGIDCCHPVVCHCNLYTSSKKRKRHTFQARESMKIGQQSEVSLPEEDDPAQSKERPQTGKLGKKMIGTYL